MIKNLYKIALKPFWILSCLLLFVSVSFGQTIRFQNSLRGGLTVATNGLNLNSSTTFVNTAGGTQMSSSSDLVLPPNSTIVKAILYVEGYAGIINQVDFSYPGSGGLVRLNNASPGFISNPTQGSYSQFIVDVTNTIPNTGYTSTVVAGGNPNPEGRYAIADIRPYDSGNYGYGWSIFVVYTNPNSNYRNVTIADQNVTYGLGSSSTINVPNITVPAIGPINAMVIATGTWGDPGILYRDNIRFGVAGSQVALDDPVTGANNDVLNGTVGFSVPNNVTDDGVVGMVNGNFVARNPYQGFGGTQGSAMYYDCDVMDASGILNPSAVPINLAIVQAGQGSDALGVGSYGVSVDVAAAVLTKSVNPTIIPSGGTATYTFTIDNNRAGAIDLTGIGFTDAIPAGLEIQTPNCVNVTGGTGGTVTANPGTNTFTLSNLDLLAGDVCTITLCVTNKAGRLNPECGTNPADFTNGFSNISNNTENLANAVTDQCLVILGDPTPGFSATEVCFGLATQFTDTSKALPTTSIVRWDWDFGVTPTATSTTKNPAFTFPAPGAYNVTLTIESSDGKIVSVTNPVTVKALPDVTLTHPAEICENESAQLEATGGDSYAWTGAGLSATNIFNPIAAPSGTTTYNVKVTDSATQCEKDTSLELVVNPLPTAAISGNLDICQGDPTTLTASGGTNYHWTLGGETSASITVSPTVTTNYEVNIEDAKGCKDTTDVDVLVSIPADAGPDFSGVICNNDNNFDLKTFLDPTNTSGGTWSVAPGQSISAGAVNQNSGIFNAENENSGVYDLLYAIDPNNACPIDEAVLELTIADTPTVVLTPLGIHCEGEDFNVEYTLGPNGNNFSVYFKVNNFPRVENGVSGTQSFVLPGTQNQNIQLDSVRIQAAPGCAIQPNILDTGKVNIPPKVTVVSSVCNSTGTAIDVSLQFADGDPATYELKVDGVVVNPLTNLVTVTPGSHTFELTDAAGCSPVSVVNFTKGCNCTTDPGSMVNPIDTIFACANDKVLGNHNADEFLDANDALGFILHDAAGTSPGTIFGQFAANDSFAFDANNMSFGQVYYISAIAGDDDGSGFPDVNAVNGCTQTAPGIPVVWNRLPDATNALSSNSICESDPVNLSFVLLQGLAPFSAQWSENATAQTPVSNLFNGDVAVLSGYTNGQVTFDDFYITDANACTAKINTNLLLDVQDSVTAVLDSIVCASDDQSYEVYLTISNGNGNFIVDDKITNTSTNSTGFFGSSGSFPTTSAYNFEVYDANQCNTIVITGNHTCNCRSTAPDMDETSVLQEFCNGSVATVSVTMVGSQPSGYVGDANDTWSYVLCTNPNDPKASWIAGAISKTPSFDFNNYPVLQNDVTYYISPIAGDEDPNNPGLVDFANAVLCPTYFKQGTPVVWLSDPTLSLTTTETDICLGETLPLNIDVVSPRAADFTLSYNNASDAAITQTGVATANYNLNIPVTPVGNGVVVVSITSNNPSFVTNTGITCTGTWDNNAVVFDVHPAPTASFVGNTTLVICESENISSAIATTGSGQITVDWTLENALVVVSNNETVALPSALAPGNYTYNINGVSAEVFAGKTCVGTVISPSILQLQVVENPTIADVTVSDNEICIGEVVQFQVDGYSGNSSNFSITDVAGTLYNANPSYTSGNFYPTQDTVFSFVFIEDNTNSDSPDNTNGGRCFTDYAVNPQTVNVKVNPLPIVNVLEGDNTMCEGASASIIFTASSLNGPVDIFYNQNINGDIVPLSELGVPADGSNVTVFHSPTDTALYSITSAVDNAGCSADLTNVNSAQIIVHKNPVVAIVPDEFASCPPLQTQIQSQILGDAAATCLWTFEDGSQILDCNPQLVSYNETGIYPVQLDVRSIYGCKGSAQENLEVYALPIPNFELFNNPTILNPNTRIRDLSELAVGYQYIIAKTNQQFFTNEPEIEFPSADTGTFQIQQILTTVNGCVDSISKDVFVNFALAVYMPNAFSPDADGINETIKPEIIGIKNEGYLFQIFNRWGELVYDTTDIKESWDGTYNGVAAQNGMYVYRISILEARNSKLQEFSGKIMLIR